jgi:hypothetical protein
MITLGSLLFNILVFILSQFLDHHTVCNRGLDWLAMVNPMFEIVKRMNAVNILFLILSEKINWRIITDTVGIIGFQPSFKYTDFIFFPGRTVKKLTESKISEFLGHSLILHSILKFVI